MGLWPVGQTSSHETPWRTQEMESSPLHFVEVVTLDRAGGQAWTYQIKRQTLCRNFSEAPWEGRLVY